MAESAAPALEVSVVIPAYNEVEAIGPLLDELIGVLEGLGRPWQVIVIDDGSTDGTATYLRRRQEVTAGLVVVTQAPNRGQSAAFAAGFAAAGGDVVVTMDADGQNDPADIPRVLAAMEGYDAVFGVRADRQDPWLRTFAQRVANLVRNRLLGSVYQDVGCSLKAFRRELIQGVTIEHGFHRFFPYLVEIAGGRGIEVDVNHRPRSLGVSKYSPLGRGLPAFRDLLKVRRLKKQAASRETAAPR